MVWSLIRREWLMHQWERVSWFKLREWKKSKGRAKIILVELVKKDMLIKEVIESMSLDRTEWQKIIHLTDAD